MQMTSLTTREARIAEFRCNGLTVKEIAQLFGISTKTVEVHITHIYKKLEVRNLLQLYKKVA